MSTKEQRSTSARDAIRAREEAKRPKKEVTRGRKAVKGDVEGRAPVGEPVPEAETTTEAVDSGE